MVARVMFWSSMTILIWNDDELAVAEDDYELDDEDFATDED